MTQRINHEAQASWAKIFLEKASKAETSNLKDNLLSCAARAMVLSRR